MTPIQRHVDIPYKKIFTTSILVLFFVFIAIFAYNKTKAIWSGIPLEISSPLDGSVITERMVEVSGNAKKAVNLTINGNQTLISKDGDFSTILPVFEGLNTVTIIAEDKFKNKNEEQVTFIGVTN